MNPSGTERVHYLDSLRGLAALAVVAGHYVAAYGDPPGVPAILLQTPLAALRDGEASVSFFFVLSGFVLSVGYFRNPERLHERFSYGAYAIARIFRIWLPFAALFLATWAVRAWVFDPASPMLASSQWLALYWQQPYGLREAFIEFSLVLPPQAHALLPPGWTLTTEISLSLLVPIGALLAERRVRWLVLLVGFAIVALGMPRFLFHFMLGIVISRLWVRRGFKGLAMPAAAEFALWTVAAVLYSYRFTVAPLAPSALPAERIWYASGLGSAMLLVLVLGAPRLQAALVLPVLRRVGRCSYSIYLVHFAILLAAIPPLLSTMARGGTTLTPLVWYAGLGALVAATLAAAFLSERFIERPSIAAGHRLSGKLSRSD